jgi:hypothetical protein
MASNSAAELESRISVIRDVLGDLRPDHPEFVHWTGQLNQCQQELTDLRRRESLTGTSGPPQSHTNGSRKRSLGLTIDERSPLSKRPSNNPSPQTPSTPDYSMFSAPFWQSQSLQNGRGEPSGHHSALPFIDLTVSDPPSPEPYPELVNAYRHEPFPELANAYRDDGARPTPADAFNQEFMRQDELAQFLIAPTAANGGYAFQQHQQAQAAIPGEPRLPFDFPNRPVPYLPDTRPEWTKESDEDDYGDFPLNATEAESIEKMLEIVQQNGNDIEDEREQTPRIMSSTLKEYQKIGLTWLLKMEASRNKGGILADEMGLGKTVSIGISIR